ncbi:MAG: S24/S26 family peptidase [Roseiflexaceae bacterium]
MVDLETRRRQQARRAAFEDYRRQGTSVWIGPRGTSMRPLIGAETKLLVEFGAAGEIGDIIVFPLGDILVAHRLVARRQRQGATVLMAKGDAEPYFDPPVRPSQVLGVARALRRSGATPVTSAGCAGWTARLIARISYSVGRSTWVVRRATAILPGPLRRMALGAISLLTRVTARILFTPLLWVVLFRSKRIEKLRGGEHHEAV